MPITVERIATIITQIAAILLFVCVTQDILRVIRNSVSDVLLNLTFAIKLKNVLLCNHVKIQVLFMIDSPEKNLNNKSIWTCNKITTKELM